MARPEIVIFGAGRIGRGFVADLFHAAGYGLTLVDQSTELISALNAAGRYTVVKAENETHRRDDTIGGFRALATLDMARVEQAVVAADMAAVAVFPQHFEPVARQLAEGLQRRWAERPGASLDVLLCANLSHAASRFRPLLLAALPAEMRALAAERVGLVETLVMRMVADPPAELQARDPLLLWTNGFTEFPVDRVGFHGSPPNVPGLRLIDDMRAEEARKLYTYNMCHASLAYLGAQRGHTLTVAALRDPAVREVAAGALDEAAAGLTAQYGFPPAEMAAWNARVLRQTDNPTLGDTIARQGADPRRKLRRADRLVGPTLLARCHSIPMPHLTRAIRAAFSYLNPNDPGAVYVQDQVLTLGLREAVRRICELQPGEEDLLDQIVTSQ